MYRDDSFSLDQLDGTAVGVFYQAVAAQRDLPVAFRITDADAQAYGLAAQGVPIAQGHARKMTFSPSWRERAAAAVMAIDFAANAIVTREQGRIKAIL